MILVHRAPFTSFPALKEEKWKWKQSRSDSTAVRLIKRKTNAVPRQALWLQPSHSPHLRTVLGKWMESSMWLLRKCCSQETFMVERKKDNAWCLGLSQWKCACENSKPCAPVIPFRLQKGRVKRTQLLKDEYCPGDISQAGCRMWW